MNKNIVKIIAIFMFLSSVTFGGVTLIGGGFSPGINSDLTVGTLTIGEYGGIISGGEGESTEMTLAADYVHVGGEIDSSGSFYSMADISCDGNIYNNNEITAGTKVSAPVVEASPSSTPAKANAGDIYYDSTSSHFMGYNGTTWVQLDN